MTGKVSDLETQKKISESDVWLKVGGIFLILLASVMSSGIAVLNRSLKQIPYSIVLFYHSLFGMIATVVILFVWCTFFDRPLYFLELARYDFAMLAGASFLDAVGVLA